jgi:hypothetical protein
MKNMIGVNSFECCFGNLNTEISRERTINKFSLSACKIEPVCLSAFPRGFVCLSACSHRICLSFLSVCLSWICLSVCLSQRICLSACLRDLSFSQSACPTISVCQLASQDLSVCLSAFSTGSIFLFSPHEVSFPLFPFPMFKLKILSFVGGLVCVATFLLMTPILYF